VKNSADKLVQLTFYAIVAYLVLVNWKGANALLRTTFQGYGGGVRALQGR
jgi:hypothetical protein